ncbi:hypothetical protein [Paracoccus marcusii]|uniref:hypothetical protein n=1 Tax=Paracoccus marcusii TaxID=59779 RepID=UPI0035A69EAB
MKLTQFDRALIHGLAVLSRPPLTPNAGEHAMLADIVAKCAERATSDSAMMPLIRAAGQVGRTPEIHRGTVHLIAAAMNDFDRWALGAHWDAARGVK